MLLVGYPARSGRYLHMHAPLTPCTPWRRAYIQRNPTRRVPCTYLLPHTRKFAHSLEILMPRRARSIL